MRQRRTCGRYARIVLGPPHAQPHWDMHAHGAELARPESEWIATGTPVSGAVVCHHHFGLGVWIPDHGQYGHVMITEIVPPGVRIRGPDDFPPIGSAVEAIVLGYTGRFSQLRLSIRRRAAA